MKIRIHGEMTLSQLRQCIHEQLHELEERFAVRHARSITLYITPTNGLGDDVVCRDGRGDAVESMRSEGPYPSAAEYYDI